SAKFTSAGSIKVQGHIQSGKYGRASYLQISVQDTGIGMTSSEQTKLFQPFSQANSGMSRKYGGTGLGLSLSRKLARALGGDLVLAQSTPGRGSIFTLTVPIDCSQQIYPENTATAADASQISATPLRGLRILLVEDSIDNQVLVTRLLKQSGIEVETASDGGEGIKRAMEKDFDAVLMDIQMPNVNGYEATFQLRKQGYQQPIIALTAHAMSEERERALESGFTDYLTKPIEKAKLLATLREIAH
ncbi:MAG: response regulator, partial [Bdellovibrionia bacterium]